MFIEIYCQDCNQQLETNITVTEEEFIIAVKPCVSCITNSEEFKNYVHKIIAIANSNK